MSAEDEQLRFTLGASYYKVANVLGFPTRPNLGDTKGALANYQKSVDLIGPLLAKDRDDSKYLLQCVQTKINWATVLFSTGEAAAGGGDDAQHRTGSSRACALVSP